MSDLTIFQVLSKIQKQLAVPKDRVNKFGGYKYRSAEDIIEAVKKLLPEGYAVTLCDDLFFVGERYYVKSTASLKNDKSDIKANAFSREAQDKKGYDQAQITLGASSYARKAALCGLFAIHDGDEAEALENAPDTKYEYRAPTPQETESAFVSKDQEFTLSDLMFKAKVDSREFFKYFNIKGLAQMPASSYEKAVSMLNKKIASKPGAADYANV